MEEPPAAAEPIAIFKKRTVKNKSAQRKRPASPPPAAHQSDSDYSSTEDEAGQPVKRRKKNTGVITASSSNGGSNVSEVTASVHSAARASTIASSNDATKASNWFDENRSDALSSKTLLGTTRATNNESAGSDGTYKGLANATTFIQKNPNAPSRVVGPVKAPTNIRTITVTDFAPDVCKDYKTTGW